MEVILKILIAYVLGSIIGALWVGRFLGHVDIRQQGSGNAGGTNALRTQGVFFALLVVIIDVGKGVVAAGWLPFLEFPWLGMESLHYPWLQFVCAAAAVVGHVFPVFHRFRGGKGAATLVGTLVVLSWQALIVVVISWLVVVAFTGYVGLATMLSIISAAVYAGAYPATENSLFIFMLAMSLFIIFTHRSNIGRMFNGKEHRMRKLMLLGRGSGSPVDDR